MTPNGFARHATRATALVFLGIPAGAQIVNPADKQKPPQDPEPDQTLVTGRSVSDLHEEDRVGPYDQPEWTTHRRFPFTRIYVRPPGTFAFEYWVRPTIPRHGPAKVRTQYEFEVGLPGRWQIDLYLNENKTGSEGAMGTENSFEVRYAFADWGKLPSNPTVYAEYKSRDAEADVVELKLLLGDELKPAWHWGANVVFEREIGGSLENVWGLTGGISHTLEDQRWSLGAELKAELINTHADRNEFEKVLLVGPSLQYRPTSHVHLDLAPLVGIGADSPALQALFVLGYEF